MVKKNKRLSLNKFVAAAIVFDSLMEHSPEFRKIIDEAFKKNEEMPVQ